jgi:hypothetical protein
MISTSFVVRGLLSIDTATPPMTSIGTRDASDHARSARTASSSSASERDSDTEALREQVPALPHLFHLFVCVGRAAKRSGQPH